MANELKNTSVSELSEIKNKIEELSKTGKRFYLSMDTETTGLSPEWDRLTSIGAVLLDENLEEVLNFEVFFNPLENNKELSKKYAGSKAEEITKLSEEALLGESPLVGTNIYLSSPAGDFEDYALLLNDIFEYPNIVKVAHNKSFDMRMMEAQFKHSNKHYFSTSKQAWLDSLEMARDLFKSNPEFKKIQEEALSIINDGKSGEHTITLNTLDSLDIFLSDHLNVSKFDRLIGGEETHGALLDSLMLSEVLKNYKKAFEENFEEFVEKEEANPKYVEYQEKVLKLNNMRNDEDLVSTNIKPNSLPIIRTSASAPSDAKTQDIALGSLRIEDLKEVFDNILEAGTTKVVISDFFMVSNMINIEDEIIKYNAKRLENDQPQLEVIMGLSVFVKDENGLKSEVDLIPKTKKDFEQITEILALGFKNNSVNPYIKVSDLSSSVFDNIILTTNGYKDIIQKDENTEAEIVSYFENILEIRPEFNMGIYETLESLNDNKYSVIEKLKEKGKTINVLGTTPISYSNLKSHMIQEASTTKEGLVYSNIADFSKDKTSYFENTNDLNAEFNLCNSNESRFIPKNDVAIPNPFDYGMDFIKNEIPSIWEKVVQYNLIDDTKSLDEQNIEEITRLYVRNASIEGIHDKAKKSAWSEEYLNDNLEAIERELSVINEMGFNGFTTFVKYFTEGEIKGKGRGSAAGSVVSYALGITDIEPLPNGLLFERYLNLLRLGFPDIDMDFGDRNGVIERKLKPFKKIDEDFTKYILTISTAGIKGSVAEVCKRTSDIDLDQTGLLTGYSGKGSKSVFVSKQILGKYFDSPGTKLKDILGNTDFEAFNDMYNNNDFIKEIVDLAGKREGMITGYGVHAAGVILKTVKDNYLNNGPILNGTQTTPIGGKIIEDYIGIKMDFLGLNSLEIIEEIQKVILKTQGQEELDKVMYVFDNYQAEMLDDNKILDLVKEINTNHIFQYGSELMKKIIQEIEISDEDDVLEMLSIVSAIGRPGVDAETFIKNKKDPENNMNLVKDYPELEPLLRKTSGVIVYEEQIMAVFKELFDYNMGEAGVIQKQIGKKKGLVKLREDILERKPNLVGLYDHLVENAGYSFNKSHSISYAVTSMMMLYLKANYKKEFFIGFLNNKIEKKDYVPSLLTDMKKEFNQININGIDINKSDFKTKELEGETRLGLGFIKGVNKSAIYKILNERKKGGNFKSLEDMVNRLKSNPSVKVSFDSLIETELSNPSLKSHIDGVLKNIKDMDKADVVGLIHSFGDYPELFDNFEEAIKDSNLNPAAKIKMLQKTLADISKKNKKTLKDLKASKSINGIEDTQALITKYDALSNYLNGFTTVQIKKELERLVKTKELGDVEDLLVRLKEETISMKTTLTKVALSGAFDSLVESDNNEESRREILEYIEMNIGTKPKEITQYTKTELLTQERELTGGFLHLSHPLDNDKLREDMKEQKYKNIASMGNRDKSSVKFYGAISSLERKVSSNGNDMFIGTVADEYGVEQFILAMVKDLSKDDIENLSQNQLPLKLEGRIAIDPDTGSKTIFISNAQLLEIDKYEINAKGTTNNVAKEKVSSLDANQDSNNTKVLHDELNTTGSIDRTLRIKKVKETPKQYRITVEDTNNKNDGEGLLILWKNAIDGKEYSKILNEGSDFDMKIDVSKNDKFTNHKITYMNEAVATVAKIATVEEEIEDNPITNINVFNTKGKKVAFELDLDGSFIGISDGNKTKLVLLPTYEEDIRNLGSITITEVNGVPKSSKMKVDSFSEGGTSRQLTEIVIEGNAGEPVILKHMGANNYGVDKNGNGFGIIIEEKNIDYMLNGTEEKKIKYYLSKQGILEIKGEKKITVISFSSEKIKNNSTINSLDNTYTNSIK